MQTTKALHIIILIFNIVLCSAQVFSQSDSYSVRTVVIDAGHGGKDPGAVGKKSYEKNLTLSMALKTGSYIMAICPDVKVIYTRSTDEFVELHRRAEIANKAKADLFISIHVNASTNPEAFGTDSWTMGIAKNDANLKVAKMENNVISLESDSTQYQGMSAGDNEAIILHQLQQGAFNDNSLSFAGRIQSRFQNDVGRKDRSIHQAPFLVLWKTAMPSVLIETGFISNAEEEEWLNQEENRDKMAEAIGNAFVDYKQFIESRSKGELQKAPVTPEPKPIVKVDEGIYYGVQIGAGKEDFELVPKNFKGLQNVFMVQEDGFYKYYYGKTKTYKDIQPLLREAKEKYPSAYVVARNKENKRISVSEAKKKTE